MLTVGWPSSLTMVPRPVPSAIPADLEMLKRRAVEEGLPYQTLIASILHKYVSGSRSPGDKVA